MAIQPRSVRATGQLSAWNPSTRSAVSRFAGSSFKLYVTWIRRITSTFASSSTSPVASEVSRPSPAGIPRASSAPPKVPVSHPAAAATM